jgi:hypothetical protein
MFPELVGRVILDGVCHAPSYSTNIYDYGKTRLTYHKSIISGFFSLCSSSSTEGCELKKLINEGLVSLSDFETEAEALQHSIISLIENLTFHPLPVATSKGVGTLTSSDVLGYMYQSFYSPGTWGRLASGLYETFKGDGSRLFELTHPGDLGQRIEGRHKNPFHSHLELEGLDVETNAIACPHAPMLSEEERSLEGVKRFYHELGELSLVGE